MTKPRIVFLMRDGVIEDVLADMPVRVFVVADDCPDDRVYEMGIASVLRTVADVDAAIGPDPVGHAGDEKHMAAVELIAGSSCAEREPQ